MQDTEEKPFENIISSEGWKWQKCRHKGCSEWALPLEYYCWEHFPPERRKNYKKNLIGRLRSGSDNAKWWTSLKDAHLKGADLSEGYLWEADLRKAVLSEANLQKASLWDADLQEANLQGANLQEAKLSGANLQGANLKQANLTKADLHMTDLRKAEFTDMWEMEDIVLREVDFSNANLEGVVLYGLNMRKAKFLMANLQDAILTGANLQQADFSFAKLKGTYLPYADFKDAYFKRVRLEGALYLRWKQILRVGEEKDREWDEARDAYCRLKNYFHQQGLYGDESQAYYRERLMSKHKYFWEWFYGYQPDDKPKKRKKRGKKKKSLNFWQRIEDFGRWFWLWFTWWFAGFGERWWLTALWALFVIAGFGALYLIGGSQGWLQFNFATEISHWFRYFYLSVVTFATLGFGDISPINLGAQICAVIEVILGYVFLGTLVSLIAHKLRR